MPQPDPWHKSLIGTVTIILAIPGAILSAYGLYQLIQNIARPPFIPSPPIKIYTTIAEVPVVPGMTVRYGGSTSFAPLRDPHEMSKRIQQVYPRFKLAYTKPLDGSNPGSNTGIRMLLSDSLNFAEASRPLKKEEYDEATGQNFSLEQRQIAYDGVVFYVNLDLHLADYPNTPLPGLTISKLKGILIGEITNWKDVGGPDIPIRVFSRDPKSGGTPQFIQETVMKNKSFAKSVQFEENTTKSIRLAAVTPGGIGYATASEVCNQKTIRSLSLVTDEKQVFVSPCNDDKNTNYVDLTVLDNGTYPLTRPMFVIIKRDGGLSEKAGVAYVNMLLSSEGQQIIRRAGLAPVHNEQ